MLIQRPGELGNGKFSCKRDRTKKTVVSFKHEYNVICSQTHEQTIICSHAVGSRPMKRHKNLNRMIIIILFGKILRAVFFTTYRWLFYLYPNGQTIITPLFSQNRIDGPTHNVIDVWKRSFTGKGVVVAVVDEGFDPEHPEIKANYLQVNHTNNLFDLQLKINKI